MYSLCIITIYRIVIPNKDFLQVVEQSKYQQFSKNVRV